MGFCKAVIIVILAKLQPIIVFWFLQINTMYFVWVFMFVFFCVFLFFLALLEGQQPLQS